MDFLKEFGELMELLQGLGVPGLVIGVLVLVGVYLTTATGLTNTPNLRRIGVLVMSLLLGGAELGDVEANMTTVLAALLATGLHELFEWAGTLIEKKKKEAQAKAPPPA